VQCNYRFTAAGIAAVATDGRAVQKADKKERPQEAPFLTAFARPDKVSTSGKPVAALKKLNFCFYSQMIMLKCFYLDRYVVGLKNLFL
jgi:hypothetical protein